MITQGGGHPKLPCLAQKGTDLKTWGWISSLIFVWDVHYIVSDTIENKNTAD